MTLVVKVCTISPKIQLGSLDRFSLLDDGSQWGVLKQGIDLVCLNYVFKDF